ncbi:MAG: hypothetical protein R3C97_06935 [Geminicoccaceae bacterium]
MGPTPPADVFRVFERGGRNIVSQFPEIGLPNSLGRIQQLEEPGRPDIRQSNRGPGTGLRVAIPVLNIHKTRLNDLVHLGFLGTNDNPGDFRTSGCGSRHVVYANDRDPRHSGPYAEFGHWGMSQQADLDDPQGREGSPAQAHLHPRHSDKPVHDLPHAPAQHVHQHILATRCGITRATLMRPKEQQYPTAEEMHEVLERNPEGEWLRAASGPISTSSAGHCRRHQSSRRRTRKVRRLSRPWLEFPRYLQA